MSSGDTATMSNTRVIKIGTRRSPLAIRQVEHTVALLQKAHPDITFEVNAIATQGDKDKVSPLPSMGKGMWTNELEAMLTSGEVDFIVHCLKDMPTTLPDNCELGAVMEREDPRDVVVIKPKHIQAGCKTIADLPKGSLVGTSSPRRSSQLKRWYPELRFRDYRGNIDTRLRKLDAEDGEFDCIILAAAGLHRMDQHSRIAQYLDSTTEGGGILHAVGQGALGLEVRKGDEETLKVLQCLVHMPTMKAGWAERTVMRTLEGGCSVPIGVETSWSDEGKTLRLRATVVALDGSEAVDADASAPVSNQEEAEALGKQVSQVLVERGAKKILDVITQTRLAPPVKTVAGAAA
ncbi:hypothetical protein PpBr36_03226 [Pyricularia pennisetigena]|uniref:hypothetical protein n=1 Tax=Pyricularia pennisetigena TaxID=1578925 RepID=UPI00114E639E|nr:hypothetical protein PpBr36_03226 [Pyricularia pennisetigena]TLS31187.1 hypothetical protein PpBr36_03226 [Pyricularia pennisetigena]